MSTLDLHRHGQGRDSAAVQPRPVVAVGAFMALAAATGALCMVLTRGTTFQADEWVWAMQRRGGALHTLLASWNGHFSLVPVLVYKLLWATVGLGSYVPYRLLVTALHVVCGGLVFLYARRRVGDLLALAGAALILTFGPGWQDFLWPFQIAWLISVASGVGALLALDRGDRTGAIGACALLCCSVASSGPGVAILAGACVEILLGPERRRRWWVVGIPALIYGAWWAAYQTTTITGYAIRHAPAFIVHLLSATFSALAGVFDAGPGTVGWGPRLGIVLALLGGLLAVWRLRTGEFPRRRAVALIAIVVLYAVAVAVNRGGLGSGADSRYLYVAAVFIVLAASELARGVAPGRLALAATAVVVGVIIGANLDAARSAGGYLRAQGALVRADLAALDIAGPRVPPHYVAAHFPGWPFIVIHVADYAALRRDLGTPAPPAWALIAYPEPARMTLDAELIGAERIALTAGPAAGTCRPAGYGALTPARVIVRFVAGARPLVVALRRFAAGFTAIGTVAAHGSAWLRLGPDGSAVPWRPSTPAGVCS